MKADKLELPLLNFFVLYTDKKKKGIKKRERKRYASAVFVYRKKR